MKQIIRTLSKNFLKFSVLGLSLHKLSIKKLNLKCETLKIEEKEKKINLSNFKNKNQNIIIVIGIDELRENYKNQALHIIKKYKQVFSDIEIIYFKSSEELKKTNFDEKIKDDTFLILKKKDEKNILELDHYKVLFEQMVIYSFFKETDVLKNFQDFNLNKFGYALGYCGENKKAENFIRELGVSKEFSGLGFNLMKFNDCQKLDSTPNDLILLKKHSKFNSLESREPKIIDEKKFDVLKNKDFFIKEKEDRSGNEVFKERNSEFMEDIAKDINKISIYDPLKIAPYILKDYTFLLVIDNNKVKNREKHLIMTKIQKIKSKLPKEIEEKISFQISFKKIKEKNISKRAFFVDEKKSQISMIYTHQNKSQKVREHLEKNFPFLVEKKENNFNYEYNLKNLNYEDFLTNLLLLEKSELKTYYPSDKEKPYKVSNKLVFNNFGKILKDKKNHCVLFYDQYCETCKYMSTIFEKMATISIMDKNDNILYHRVNNSLNSFYMMTPVLAFFKPGFVEPYFFNSESFGEKKIKDFIEVTEMTEVVQFEFNQKMINFGNLVDLQIDN